MNYPNGIKKEYKLSTSNRGMNLETDINETNIYYRDNNIAVIYKKPTPITINKVDYKSRVDAIITEAHFKTPSTTDYNGVYKGMYIDFEAKETRKEYFPLANIHAHQIKHLNQIKDCGGIGFIIVRFVLKGETYLLTIECLNDFLNTSKRKSIPIEYFKEKGYVIKEGFKPYLDYLKIIDDIRSDTNKWKKITMLEKTTLKIKLIIK